MASYQGVLSIGPVTIVDLDHLADVALVRFLQWKGTSPLYLYTIAQPTSKGCVCYASPSRQCVLFLIASSGYNLHTTKITCFKRTDHEF